MYIVWYWLGGKEERQFEMVNCRGNGHYAFLLADHYNNCWFHQSYEAWVEYKKEGEDVESNKDGNYPVTTRRSVK